MKRLTTRTSIMGRKHDIAYGCASVWKRKLKNDKYELIENAVDKLGQLEDIEEELGIDLITLFKALKNGVYSNHYAYAGEEIHKIDVELEKRPNGLCVSGGFGEGHNLKDYGKTWALTKEELENYGK